MEHLDRTSDEPVIPATRRGGTRAPRRTERAASLVEYALLVALIAVVCVLAVQQLGESGSASLEDSESRISVATS